MIRWVKSTISQSRMVLNLEVKISSKFSMLREPELASRTQVTNLQTSARRSRVSTGRRIRCDQASAKTCPYASERTHLKDSDYARLLRSRAVPNKLTSSKQGSLYRQVAKNKGVFRMTPALFYRATNLMWSAASKTCGEMILQPKTTITMRNNTLQTCTRQASYLKWWWWKRNYANRITEEQKKEIITKSYL